METINGIKIHCTYDKLLSIDEIKFHPKNRNKHPQEQIERLVKIFKYNGVRKPAVISELSGLMTAGHGRILTAIHCGMEFYPVVFQHYDSDVHEYDDIQADNAVALWAELDFEAIAEDLKEFDWHDHDMLGIQDFEILDDEFESDVDPDDVPVDPPAICKPGDLWQLGEHRLLCGDSTDTKNIDLLIDAGPIDMVFTDPPYGMNLNTKYKSSFGETGFRDAKDYKKIIGDDKQFNPSFILTKFIHVKEIFLWGFDFYAQHLPQGTPLVWNKKTTDGLKKMFGGHFELCWSKEKHKREVIDITWASIFGHVKKTDGEKKTHPTQKPVKLVEWFFDSYGNGKNNVIDLFGGSGTTLIACEKTNRKCFMMELDAHYCDVIINRWETYTNKKAVLTNGKT